MNVLLIGEKGFVGSNLRARLSKEGNAVVTFSRGPIPDLRSTHFDAVINCAGRLEDPHLMLSDNLLLVAHALETMMDINVGCFIQIGSSAETGPMNGLRKEDSPCNPSNLYEATKLAATNLCLGYAAQYHIPICVARPFSLYGVNDKPRKMLPTLWRTWKNEQIFRCYLGGHDWIHIDDFIDGLMILLHAPRETINGKIFNFGTGINTSNAEIVSLFNRAVGGAGVKTDFLQTKYHPHDVMDWRADTTKTEAVLGWKAKVGVQEGINNFVSDMWFAEERVPGL